MAKVKIQGHASGTGVLTVTAPNTSTDRTITLPDSTGTLATTADVPSSITDNGDATALTIDSSEKIGIGTSSPARLLTVYGDTGIALQNSTTGTGTGNGSHIWVNSEGSGELLIQNRENSDIEFFTNDTERMRILAGGGLTFNGDTASANALDDYEEGTWSPVFNVTGGSVTMHSSRDVGRYTKIGRVVQIQGQFSTGTASSPSGTFTISGLPFANGSDVDLSEEFLFFIGANNIVNNSGKPLIGYVGASSSTITVYNQDGNDLGAAGNVLQSNSYLGFTATYTI